MTVLIPVLQALSTQVQVALAVQEENTTTQIELLDVRRVKIVLQARGHTEASRHATAAQSPICGRTVMELKTQQKVALLTMVKPKVWTAICIVNARQVITKLTLLKEILTVHPVVRLPILMA